MAGQKFFHGLTDAMINRATADRPDRQKSNFYWPDEYMQDSQETFRTSNGGSSASSRRPSTASSSATATPKECMSPIGDSAEVLKLRHRSNARSHIEFYDDCDTSFTALEREKQRTKLGIEKFHREQDEDASEAAKTRRQNTLKSKIHFYDYEEPPQTSRTPSRQQSNGHYQPAATPEYPEEPRFSPVNNGTPPVHSFRRQQSSPATSEYHYSARYTGTYDDFEDDRFSCKSNDYGFSPPGTPVSGGGGGDVPEHKRNSQRHLRSSIAFCNGVAIAEDSSAPRKPASVRDAASAQRVGVGLPNL